MAIFPVSPSVGQEETVLGRTFVYDGYGWVAKDKSGHAFEDSTDTTLPTRSVAKAGDGIEFEDDAVGEKTVVRVSDEVFSHVDGADEEKHTGNQISIDAAEFDGNLDSAITDVQKLAEAVDDLDVGGGGGHTIADSETTYLQRDTLEFTDAEIVDEDNITKVSYPDFKVDNFYFAALAPDFGVITRPFDFKVTVKDDFGGTSTIVTSADVAYTLDSTVTAGNYLKITGDTIGMRTALRVERV